MMGNRFFEKPILNSPYEYPARHWELDDQGQPTQQIFDRYGRWAFAEFTDVYQIESDFEARVEAEFNKIIDQVLTGKV